MWRFWSAWDHSPLQIVSPRWAPHPWVEASQKSRVSCNSGWSGQPNMRFFGSFHHSRWPRITLETGIFRSKGWGNRQFDLRNHWKGRMWSLPRGTVFSRQAKIPIRDMSCLADMKGLFWFFSTASKSNNYPFIICSTMSWNPSTGAPRASAMRSI